MTITQTMAPGQVAAFDQSLAEYRAASRGFAGMSVTGTQWAEAEARLRNAGFDAATGLTTIPVAAVRFADVRADGARVRAMSSGDNGIWLCWAGRSLPCGIESREYGEWDLIQVKASI